eukprot:535486_1
MPESETVEGAQMAQKTIAGIATNGLLSLMVEVGKKSGLFDAAADGAQTSEELSKRSGVNERYAREWLSALACAGIFDYAADTKKFRLKPGFQQVLCGPLNFLTAMTHFTSIFGQNIDKYVDVFKNGGGVGYENFERFQTVMNGIFRSNYDNDLIAKYLPNAKEVYAKLQAGEALDILDVGCGSGHAINVMAKAFPKSEFTGMDFSQEAVDRATTEAREMGLANARFILKDIGESGDWGSYDLICAFDSIHDLAKPQEVLNNVRNALKPGGFFLMQDIMMSSDLENNLAHPMAPILYSVSTMHCMTVSLAQDGGVGVGTCWGKEKAQEMLQKAGFSKVELYPAADSVNVIYISQ